MKIINPDWFKNLLAMFLVSAFTAVIPLLIFKDIPTSNRDIITYMVGQLSGMALMALGFYFTQKAGQDVLDTKRADNTTTALNAITAVANAGSTPAPADAIEAAQDVADTAQSKANEIKESTP
ncbi:hypothetical protein D3Y57_19300 [Sphingomonas paeninsulae]|uniref:Holin n=1 Tax=Sphingomonas paeninsulae TaxID=2319844 RepID=A0A494TEH7_SPHPE|nr:hypothetical protein [Sphingomonas paeninsulae]AYJ87680.1 hypothetical protein D3Y57_19300 [Sphingomonas paeninsulae]